ncbi:neuronal acetylcholine receptor subunit alpha-10-like isoform X1 [Haliotis cracherodii]|uniref:neuronal acetylcholine receptor subunit alpha-10-like isoform X1 n=1 Tax=Haliotis cracherodii TaxID=6455 RepID=UPI0039E8D60E
MDYWSVWWKILAVCCSVTMSLADDNEYRLVRDLLQGYDKRIRPSINSSERLNVTFGVALAQIIDVDEKNQILTTNCWLNQMWLDYGLRWDPDKYGGIKVIRLPHDSVWRPDILLYNNADVSSFFSSISSNVIVNNDGNVTWLSMVIFKSSCSINVRYFPFDEQNCSLLFSSWTYDGLQLDLIMNSPHGDTSNYIHNSEWLLVKLLVKRNVVYYSCCDEPYPDITYYIHIRRRPLFYIFNMILPCILITLVALLGFYIPSDSGEKVTMGITTLLSMTVFMMLVTENMPPTSDVLPLIGIYYGMTIFIVSFATGMTVFTLNIHHKGTRGREVPSVIRKIAFSCLAKMFCIKVQRAKTPAATAVFTPDCNGTTGSSSYIRFKMAPQSDPESAPSKPVDFKPGAPEVPPTIDMVDVKLEDPLSTNGGFGTHFPRFRSGQAGSSAVVENFEQQFMRVLQKVYQTIEQNEIRLADQDRREAIKIEWQQVAQIVDRMLLSGFVALTMVITGVVLLGAPASVSSMTS